MAGLLGSVAKPAAATRTIEVQFFLLFRRTAAPIDNEAYQSREEDNTGHNANYEGIVHGSGFLVSQVHPGCNEK